MKMKDVTIDFWIDRMREIAHKAHKGQTRNNGRPYIEHPERVAAKCEKRLKPIALGHDLLEDTTVTLDDLKQEGFPTYILAAVDLLTHRKGDTNMAYWQKILTNPDAVTIKLLDIQDNLGETPSEYARTKYAKALALFKQHGYSP